MPTRLPLLFAALFCTSVMAAVSAETETPNYDVLVTEDSFELREYGPMIVAQTTTSGQMDSASNQAFRRLAGYIFGDNTSRIETTAGSEKAGSEKIAMTAPVITAQSDNGWVTSFVMPSEYEMEELPRPNDESVEIIVDPGGRYAVVRFSGLWSDRSFEKHLGQLQIWIVEKSLEVIGEPIIARYDPPWTPWFMRRNEVMIPVAIERRASR